MKIFSNGLSIISKSYGIAGLLSLLLALQTGQTRAQQWTLGADLSYVNEMEDCGALYGKGDTLVDPFDLMAASGCQVVRLRLWHTPDSGYSGYADVHKAIARAKASGMKVLLDFHYSDSWADPAKQTRPRAWWGISNLSTLGDSLYQYTYHTLQRLKNDQLTPDFVQVGNETNGNIVVDTGEVLYPIDWERNVALFNRGLQAVSDVDASIRTVIHIADPTVALWWFTTARDHGLTGYDIAGLSYYPQYHDTDITGTANVVATLHTQLGKDVWVVETGYPWTLENADAASNILDAASILPGYSNPPTPKSQKNFLINLSYAVIHAGGMGVVYWEPAWVSTDCFTQWGQGSHYDNATFFDFDNRVHEGIQWYDYDYTTAPSTTSEVTFMVDMTGVDIVEGVYVTGDFTGTAWQFMPMTHMGNQIYKYVTTLEKGSEGAYIFTVKADWDMNAYHEHVPAECAPMWGTHRQYNIEDDHESYAWVWSTCEAIPLGITTGKENHVQVYPNPCHDQFAFSNLSPDISHYTILDLAGRRWADGKADECIIDCSRWPAGYFFINFYNDDNRIIDTLSIIKQSH